MFYLRTKDGEQIITSAKSDDREEFGKVIEDKLGSDAERLYNQMLEDDAVDTESYITAFAENFKDCIAKMDKILNETDYDEDLVEILEDLQELYFDLISRVPR